MRDFSTVKGKGSLEHIFLHLHFALFRSLPQKCISLENVLCYPWNMLTGCLYLLTDMYVYVYEYWRTNRFSNWPTSTRSNGNTWGSREGLFPLRLCITIRILTTC